MGRCKCFSTKITRPLHCWLMINKWAQHIDKKQNNTKEVAFLQVVYQPGGYTLGFMAYTPTPLDHMNTVGHGILDPPHLHMSQLEPSGMRPSDPVPNSYDGLNPADQEDCFRQQLNSVTEGIETIMVNAHSVVSCFWTSWLLWLLKLSFMYIWFH